MLTGCPITLQCASLQQHEGSPRDKAQGGRASVHPQACSATRRLCSGQLHHLAISKSLPASPVAACHWMMRAKTSGCAMQTMPVLLLATGESSAPGDAVLPQTMVKRPELALLEASLERVTARVMLKGTSASTCLSTAATRSSTSCSPWVGTQSSALHQEQPWHRLACWRPGTLRTR